MAGLQFNPAGKHNRHTDSAQGKEKREAFHCEFNQFSSLPFSLIFKLESVSLEAGQENPSLCP